MQSAEWKGGRGCIYITRCLQTGRQPIPPNTDTKQDSNRINLSHLLPVKVWGKWEASSFKTITDSNLHTVRCWRNGGYWLLQSRAGKHINLFSTEVICFLTANGGNRCLQFTVNIKAIPPEASPSQSKRSGAITFKFVLHKKNLHRPLHANSTCI